MANGEVKCGDVDWSVVESGAARGQEQADGVCGARRAGKLGWLLGRGQAEKLGWLLVRGQAEKLGWLLRRGQAGGVADWRRA